ncbi:MAG: GAF domain-containing protein, partial [Leptospiraceae bacterium]|nr:GAF domain-containing protein [Leptospiraceae bacterium]
SEKLLEDKDETIDEALEIIRKLSDVDRIVLVKNFKSKKNKLYMKVQSEITSPIIEKRKVANISYSGSFNLIREALQKGKEIHWTLDSSPKKINKLLQKLNIKSLLFIPVFIKGKWEGFLSFEDSVFRKNWNDSDIQLIQTIARMIGTKLEIEQAQNEIKVEKEKSDNLLLNILPSKIAEELKEKGEVKPTSYNSASILFTDFKGFTRIAARKSPEKLLDDLNVIFLQFDQICERRQVEKLKTIGDSFMCAGGLPVENNSHPIDICLAALEMNSFLRDAKAIVENITGEEFWDMRIGIHTGSVVAGVVGKSKFAYDIWGDAVNIASRMESSCEVGKINISVDTYNLVKDFFNCDYRGKIEAKNRGEIEMYFLYGIKLELSKNREGLVPSDEFFELMRQKGMI